MFTTSKRDISRAIKTRLETMRKRYTNDDLRIFLLTESDILRAFEDNRYCFTYDVAKFSSGNYRFHKQYWMTLSIFRNIIKSVTEDVVHGTVQDTIKIIFRDDI